MNRISYGLIFEALEHYSRLGFTYVEVPWLVSRAAVDVTLPADRTPFMCGNDALVGSAEQSFIQLILDGKLRPGRYVAASPCFRDDPVDEWHQKTFFKVELIVVGKNPLWGPRKLAEEARRFFALHGASGALLKTTDDSVDVELGGIELGSYGWRRYSSPEHTFEWTYGTGLAEPRFSMALLNARTGA